MDKSGDASPVESLGHARDCAFCHKRFWPTRKKQVYCSNDCKIRALSLARTVEQPSVEVRYCEWCDRPIASNNPKARYCSNGCRLSAFKAKPCIYCGAPAEARDHFIPRAFAQRVEDFASIPLRKLTVPCCTECNSTAGSKVFLTLREKREYILERYQKKYKRIIECPSWREKEIEELGGMLQAHVRRGVEYQRYIKARIRRLSR